MDAHKTTTTHRPKGKGANTRLRRNNQTEEKIDKTMTLTRRSAKDLSGSLAEDGRDARKDGKSRMRKSFIAVGFLSILVFGGLGVTKVREVQKDGRIFLDTGVFLQIDLDRTETDGSVKLGPHTVTLQIEDTKICPYPRFFLRAKNVETLMAVDMKQQSREVGAVVARDEWRGMLMFPSAGVYDLEYQWHGCKNKDEKEEEDEVKTVKLDALTSLLVRQDESSPKKTPSVLSHSTVSVAPAGTWMHPLNITGRDFPNYRIWMSHFNLENKQVPTTTKDEGVLTSTIESLERHYSLVYKDATPIPDDFRFLSNYELTCWVGSRSAELLRAAFLSLRPQLFPQQRPFKFHYYPMTDFTDPMKNWKEERMKGFRKCKIILVSVDEPAQPIGRREYKAQVTNFLQHLIKAFPDETFPIWMLTMNKSPADTTDSLCAPSSSEDPRSSNHPCNDALFQIFHSSQDLLPSMRVKLMDNTDLTNPLFVGDHDNTYTDILSIVAMRIYSLVGHQVHKWRSMKQEGKKDGLMRDGVLEPNFELVPYDFSKSLMEK